MLKVVLLAAAVAARRDEGRPKTPIFFFHFHKAGGTSFCELFSRAGLRTPAKMTRRGFEGCNCNTRLLGNNATGHHLKQAHTIDETWRAGGAARMAIAMAAAGLDVCMIEESWKFPTPSWPVWTYTLVNKLRADKMCKGCSPPPPVRKPTRRMWGA
jgi:hypothetical protein